MKKKTVTLWNVPIPIAEGVVQSLRNRAANELINGGSMEEINKLLYAIEACESELEDAKKGQQEQEQEDEEDE